MVPGVGNQRKKTRISHNKQEYFSFDSLLDIDPELLLCSEDASASQIGSVGHRASLFQNLVSSQVFWTTHLAATTDNKTWNMFSRVGSRTLCDQPPTET